MTQSTVEWETLTETSETIRWTGLNFESLKEYPSDLAWTKTAVHVEGNYKDIVDWMDYHPVNPVRYSDGHGERVEDEDDGKLNWGLYSICTDRDLAGSQMSYHSGLDEKPGMIHPGVSVYETVLTGTAAAVKV
jgi:hypothetical protein